MVQKPPKDLIALSPEDLVAYALQLEKEVRVLRDELERLQSALTDSERVAYYDALTSIPNRHGFERYIQALQILSHKPAFQDSTYHGKNGGLLVVHIDIDHFKDINNMVTQFGGDDVLRQFTARLAGVIRAKSEFGREAATGPQCMRQLPGPLIEGYMLRYGLEGMDLLSRWGGSEFFCLLPLCYAQQISPAAVEENADKIAARLLHAIREKPLVVQIGNNTFNHLRQNVIDHKDHYYGAARLLVDNDTLDKKLVLPITASISYKILGWNEFVKSSEHNTNDLFRSVVDLMRQAKAGGRNRAVTMRPSLHDGTLAVYVMDGTGVKI